MGKKHPTLEQPDNETVKKVMKIQEKLTNTTKLLLNNEELGEMSKAVRIVINMIIELYHDDVYNEEKTFALFDDLLFTYNVLVDKFDKEVTGV